MPTPTEVQLDAARVAYYLAIQDTLLRHLRDRAVIGFGRPVLIDPRPSSAGTDAQPSRQAILHIHDFADLDEAVRSGIVGFLLPGLTGLGMIGMQIRAGAGTGIDTVATATLSLAESMAQDGLATTAMTDGAGGIYLFAFEVGALRSPADAPPEPSRLTAARSHPTDLAAMAPEMVTTDRSDFAGRALIEPLTAGSAPPAPYSVVTATDPTGVIVPLTLDEVAAASAGMPLEIAFDDVPVRIREYGDLAAALSEATALPA